MTQAEFFEEETHNASSRLASKFFDISIAKTKQELFEIFRLRELVLTRQNKYIENQKLRMIFDAYDFLPSTYHLALRTPDKKIIGSIRITAWHAEANPAEKSFDFTKFLANQKQQPGLPNTLRENSYDLGRLVVSKSFSGHGIGSDLFRAGCLLAVKLGSHYLTAIANPEVVHLWLKIGLEPAAGVSTCLQSNLPFVPIIGSRFNIETTLKKCHFDLSLLNNSNAADSFHHSAVA